MKPRRFYSTYKKGRVIKLPFLAVILGYLKSKRRVFVRMKTIYKKFHLFTMELRYFLHIFIRRPHDHAYHKYDKYKKYADHPATKVIHRSAVAGFWASTLIFLTLQYAIPGMFSLFNPRKVLAGDTTVKWEQQQDFVSNAISGGTGTTNRAGLDTPGGGGLQMQSSAVSTGAQGSKTVSGTHNINEYITSYNGTTVIPQFDSLTIASDGILTTSAGVRLSFITNTLNINGGGAINVDGLGYAGGVGGLGAGVSGAAGAGPGGGSANGGHATYPNPSANVAIPEFGSGGGGGVGHDDAPVSLGIYCDVDNYGTCTGDPYEHFTGGGPAYGPSGGNGGGAVKITVGAMTLSGSISAKGMASGGAGSGSGGAVLIYTVNAITGSGSIDVSGGTSNGGATKILAPSSSITPVGGTNIPLAAWSPPARVATLGGTSAGFIGLRVDAGANASLKAKELNWLATTGVTDQKILFKVRVGNSQAELNTNKCYGPGTGISGTGFDDGCNDWSTPGKFFSQVNASDVVTKFPATLPGAIDDAVTVKRFTEIIIRFEAIDDYSQTLSWVSMKYGGTPKPGTLITKDALNTTIVTNTTGQTATGWYNLANNGTANLVFDAIPNINGNVTPEVVVKVVDSGSTAPTFASTDVATITGTPVGGTKDISSNMTVVLPNLIPNKTYYWKSRYTDASGVLSPWSDATGILGIDISEPIVTDFKINNGDLYSGSAVTLSIAATDPGSAGVSKMRFSNNGGTNWGYSTNSDGTISDSSWGAYAATKSLNLLTGSGTRTVHVQIMDAAGNTSDKKYIDKMDYPDTIAASDAFVGTPTGELATGGTVSTVGAYTLHTFTGSNGTTFTSPTARPIEVQIIGGGGGGEINTTAGHRGGGAGQVITQTGITFLGGKTYNITIGAGNGQGSSGTASFISGTGLTTYTAAGGQAGQLGGASGNGFAGGSAALNYGGGGGGATAAGGPGSSGGGGGNGGAGISAANSYDGVARAGGGGGGGGDNASTNGTGNSGGGAGGYYYYDSKCACNETLSAGSGGPNTGSGGGGASYNGGNTSGNGGSGIVLIRYLTPTALPATSEATIKKPLGGYSLKLPTQTTVSANSTYTKTFSTPLNLSNKSTIVFDIRATRTGSSNIKLGIHDTDDINITTQPNILSPNTFQTVNWDISGYAGTGKDNIDTLTISILNATADNDIYIDNMYVDSALDYSDNITVDNNPPVILANTITAPSSGSSLKGGATNAAVTWNPANISDAGLGLATNPIKLEYYDGSAYNTLPGAGALANSGSYTWASIPLIDTIGAKLRLSATDIAGNVATQEVTFVIDTNGPTINLTSPITGGYINSISASSSVSYTLNDISGIGSGSLIFTQTGGVADPSSPHTCTLRSAAYNNGTHNNVDLTNTSTGCASTPALVEGAIYTVTLTAIDTVSNSSSVTRTGIMYDTTAPTLVSATYNSGSSSSNNNTSISVILAATDNESGVDSSKYDLQYQSAPLNGNNPTTWGSWTQAGSNNASSSPYAFTGTTGFAYKFKVSAINNAGLRSSYTAGINWVGVDTSAPYGTISINNDDVATTSLNVNVTFSLSDDESGITRYRINNSGSWSDYTDISGNRYPPSGTITVPVTFENDTQETKTISIEITNGAGTITTISDTIAYDSTAPLDPSTPEMYAASDRVELLPSDGISLGWFPNNNPYLYFTGIDNESGVQYFKYCVIKSGETCNYSDNPDVPATLHTEFGAHTYTGGATLSLADIRQGILTIHMRSYDVAGNFSQNEATYDYKFDKTIPSYVSNFKATPNPSHPAPYEDKIVLTWDKSSNVTPVAPIEYYKIERLKALNYTGINDGAWWNLPTYQTITCETASPFACLDKDGNNIGTVALDGSTYTFENSPAADGTLDPSTKYIYRISAKDYSNDTGGPKNETGDPNTDGYGPVPENGSQNQNEVYGYTKDTAAPEVPPTSVTAEPCDGASNDLCNSDLTKRGKRVKVSWLPATDALSGVDYYEVYRREGGPNDLNGWTKVGSPTETTDGLLVRRVYYDDTISDAKYYSYRIMSFDKARPLPANFTPLIPGGLINDVTNATPQAVYIFDVTPPIIPSSFAAQAMGIDCFDAECIPHQQVDISWQKTTDNNSNSTITYKLYRSTLPDSGFVEQVAAGSLTPDENDAYLYEDKGLLDRTTYYYKLEVTDNVANSATSLAQAATTGNSLAPNQPTYVTVSNSDSSLTDKAHQLKVTFTGSGARAFDEVTKDNGVVRYDIYMAFSNLSPDKSRSADDGTVNDCGLSETADDCWIRINSAQPPVAPITQAPIGDDNFNTHIFTASNLTEATQYFFRIRATDNGKSPIDGSPAPLTSILSAVQASKSPTEVAACGWNITRDLTAPRLPADGLDVKVRDTHPNSTVLRNIVSWKILSSTPLRKKLSYETAYDADTNPLGCKIVVSGGIDYCNDFNSYMVYRQVLDSGDHVIYTSPTPIKTELNPETNYYIDEIGNTDLIGGIGGSSLFIDAKIRYYVKVNDSAFTTFLYPNGTKINDADNETAIQLSGHTIIPSKVTPLVVGAVDVSDQSVASAAVTWQTDQDTDALVEFREKFVRNDSGEITDVPNSQGDYSYIGASKKPGDTMNVQNHTVHLFGLKPNTEYEYAVISRNYLGNNIDITLVTLPMLETTGFDISYHSDQTVLTTVSAELHWTTNMPSNTNIVEYSESNGSQTGSVAETPIKLSGVSSSEQNCSVYPKLCEHSVTISPLKKNTEYAFSIVAVSIDNFNTSSGINKFTTSNSDAAQFTVSPSASNVAERNITSTSAQIVFSTSEETTATLYYDVQSGSPTYDTKQYKLTATDSLKGTTHIIPINGLVPGTKYYYVVRVDNGLLTYTSPESFFTAVLKPRIDNLRIAEVKPYSFKLTWETNIDTETMINLGTSANYGEKRGKPGLVKTHEILVDQLQDNTEYHYQILAKDETGNEVATADAAIRTPMDTEGPKITNVKVDVLPMGENDTTSSVIFSWQTDKPATTLVEYDEGIIGGDYGKRSTEDLALNNSHTVIIKGLAPASSYHYRLVSSDKRNNKTISQDYTFVTPTKEKSILQLILKSLEETFAWTKNLGQFFNNIGKRLTGKS